MSGAAVSNTPVVRLPARAVETGPISDADGATQSAFPDLLAKLANTSGDPGGECTEGVADPPSAMDRAMARLAAARNANGTDAMALLAALQDESVPPTTGEKQLATSDGQDDVASGDGAAATGTVIADGVQGMPPAADSRAQDCSIGAAIAGLLAAQAGVAAADNARPASSAPVLATANTVVGPDQDPRAQVSSREPATTILSSASTGEPVTSPSADTPQAPPSKLQPPARSMGGEVAPNLTVAVTGRETHITPALQRLSIQVPENTDAGSTDAGSVAVATDGDEPTTADVSPRRPVLANGQRPPTATGDPSSSPGHAGGQQASRDGESLRRTAAIEDSVGATTDGDQTRVTTTPPSPPVQQVAGRIVAAARGLETEVSRSTGVVPAKVASPAVVKVLRLELQPADLGTITIRMSLRQEGLDVRVEAGRPETARMMQADQEALSKVLSNAGYRIDHMSVAAASFDGSTSSDGRGQPSPQASTSQQGWSQEADARSSGGRQNAEPDRRAFRGRQNDETQNSGSVPGAGGHLYV